MSGLQSALLGAGGGLVPNGLINGTSGALCMYNGPNDPNVLLNLNGYVRVVATGALVSNVLKPILNLSGKGALSFLGLMGADAATRTHRVRVTIDGIVIFDGTSPAVSSGSQSASIIGSICPVSVSGGSSGIYSVMPEYLCFDSSLLIEYASSISETGKTYIAYRYTPRA